jgi:hypothetical protein
MLKRNQLNATKAVFIARRQRECWARRCTLIA